MRLLRVLRISPVASVVLCACLSFTGCKKADDETPEVKVSVQAALPTVGDISEQIAADAILAPLEQAAITPRISAPIRAEYVQRGSHVRRGQLLLSLDARDLEGSALDNRGALRSAEATYTATTQATIPEDLKKAQGDVDQARAAQQVAKRAADERRRLFEQGALSGRDADSAYALSVQADAALAQAKKHLENLERTTSSTTSEAAQGQLLSARGRLQNAEAQVNYASLRSPIDGVVTDRPLFPGETAQSGTPVITVMNTSFLLAKLHVAQAAAQELVLGRPAQVTVPGLAQPAAANLSFLGPALDPGSTTVEVWLKLANQAGQLKVGTPVHVVMVGRTVHNAVTIPASALVPGQGGASVMVIGRDEAAHKRAVQTGVRTSERVQIVSGLSASERVITEGGYGLDDGTKVEVVAAGEHEPQDGQGESSEAPAGHPKDRN